MPVSKAVATLAISTIISQVVTMVYNLADTFFVGQIGDPLMVAAVSLVSPWFNLLTALGHLLRSEDHAKQASAGMMFGGLFQYRIGPLLHRSIY